VTSNSQKTGRYKIGVWKTPLLLALMA